MVVVTDVGSLGAGSTDWEDIRITVGEAVAFVESSGCCVGGGVAGATDVGALETDTGVAAFACVGVELAATGGGLRRGGAFGSDLLPETAELIRVDMSAI